MALREILAHFGFTFDKTQLDGAARAVNGVKTQVQTTGRSLANVATGLRAAFAGFVASEIAHVTGAIAEQAAQLQDLSEQTGLATDDLQAWTLAANLGGASAADFTGGLRKLSKELATGVDESGQQSKLFKRLGIDAKDGSGNVRELSDVLPEIAEKFKGLRTGAEKSALAQQIFGRAGSKLVPILSEGAAGVAKLKEQFEALGGGFSKEAIANADAYDDALVKLNFSFFGLKSLIATQVFPWLAKTVETITHASVAASKWMKETTALGTGVKLLAGLLAGKLALALAPYLLPGLKFLALFLAIDDFLAFLEGKDSVIGDLLNRAFGAGAATVVRAWCNDAKDAIVGTFIGALDLLRIAFASTDEESKTLWQHFELATRPVERILDSIFSKLQAIKDAFTDWDTIKTGANDFLDAITSPLDSDEDRAQKRQRKTAQLSALSDDAVRNSGLSRAGNNPAHAALGNAYANIANGVGGYGPSAPVSLPSGGAPVTNNISPVTVSQVFAPGTGPEVRKIAKEAAREGVNQGLSEYRAALQSIEQRAP